MLQFVFRTADESHAGTDDTFFLKYYVNDHALTTCTPKGGFAEKKLDITTKDDRERDESDAYQVPLQAGDQQYLGGVEVPRGIAYENFDDFKLKTCLLLETKGRNLWKMGSYYVDGFFKELRQNGNSYEAIDLGLRIIATNNRLIRMSRDSSEGNSMIPLFVNRIN